MLDGSASGGERGGVVESGPATFDDVFMTAKEVSAFLRVEESYLANLRARGEGLPFYKSTGRILYKAADVLAMVNHGARGFTRQKLQTAIETFPGLKPAQRCELLAHIIERLSK